MSSVDLKRIYKDHYTANAKPALVEVLPRPYLMVPGRGDPNTSQEYADAIATIYPVAYGLRKAVKEASNIAYTVMPLEGLWWVDDLASLSFEDKTNWNWIAMICQPDEVTAEMADSVIPRVTADKNLAAGDIARLETFGDGLAVQILHVGPDSDEQPTIARLHHHIETEGFQFRGRHHEIYLSDARNSPPAKLHTILCQPV